VFFYTQPSPQVSVPIGVLSPRDGIHKGHFDKSFRLLTAGFSKAGFLLHCWGAWASLFMMFFIVDMK
jgi:hypothetical protein